MNADAKSMQDWLSNYLRGCGGVAGTVHLREGAGLTLGAAVNIPPPVQEAVRWVPNGKGMAGLALKNGEPVQTCNLKEDESGRVKPGAKAVAAQAAIAFPVRDATGAIVAVVGVAFMEERAINQPEIDRLLQSAADFPLLFSSSFGR